MPLEPFTLVLDFSCTCFLYNCNLKFLANVLLSKVNKNLGELLIKNTCYMIVHIAFKSLFFGTGHIT